MRHLLKLVTVLIIIGIAPIRAADIPPLDGHRVNDLAHLLKDEERGKLAEQLRAIEEKTTAQVAILTLPRVPEGKTMQTYTLDVANAWKLGQKGKDNGILIAYAVTADDKKDHYFIQVGYGLESVIPDAVAGDIVRNVLRRHADPKNKKHDFFGAFQGAAEVIGTRILKSQSTAEPAKDRKAGTSHVGPILLSVIGFIAAMFFIFIIFRPSRRKADRPEREEGPRRTRHRERVRPVSRHPVRGSGRRSTTRRDDDDGLAGALLGAALASGGDSDESTRRSSASEPVSTPDIDIGFDSGGGSFGGAGAGD